MFISIKYQKLKAGGIKRGKGRGCVANREDKDKTLQQSNTTPRQKLYSKKFKLNN
jgi:hypothetical protein